MTVSAYINEKWDLTPNLLNQIWLKLSTKSNRMCYDFLFDGYDFGANSGAVAVKIPGYKIEHLIAEGGMASVYLATQESLGRYVALKLLRKFENANQSKRFFNEGQTLAALSHQNIITIYDVGVTDDEQPYISMEYLEGGDLEARIERGLNPNEALQIIEVVGECLKLVHQQGIVHRDIKPANILFHRDGTAILSDFGIAKQETRDTQLTMEGSAMGSPYYLSPEQAECKTLDGRADIYGLGIVLYEMLTGEKPYQGDSYIETIAAHLYMSLPVLPPQLSQYQDLLNKMIAKSPHDRFANAGEMLQSLHDLRDTEAESHQPVAENKSAVSATSLSDLKQTPEHRSYYSKIKQSIAREFRANKASLLSGLLTVLLTFTALFLWLQQADEAVSVEAGEDIIDSTRTQPAKPDSFTSIAPATNSEKAKRIKQYMAMAHVALREYRLILPKNKNAYYYYQQILDMQPNHQGATEGMGKIAHAYANLAESALNKFNYPRAKEFVNLGLSIQPENARLLQLEKNTNVFTDAPKRAINKIKALFR